MYVRICIHTSGGGHGPGLGQWHEHRQSMGSVMLFVCSLHSCTHVYIYICIYRHIYNNNSLRGHFGSRRFKPACSSFVKMPASGLPPHGASPELRSVAFALGRLWRQKPRGLPLAVRESFLDLLLVVQPCVLPTCGSCRVTISEARDDVKGLIDLGYAPCCGVHCAFADLASATTSTY